jgi:hypothetical protein
MNTLSSTIDRAKGPAVENNTLAAQHNVCAA